MRKLPIGIQGFEKLITKDFIYVDKTEYIYQLIQQSTPIFLSRPRRFGKSLLISTMKAYWQGKKELFKNLKIAKLKENDWLTYPVFHFDFDGGFYSENRTGLESRLNEHLCFWEKEYGIKPDEIRSSIETYDDNELNELGIRFRYLMMEAHRQTGQRVVVLVDEYDKPLLEVMDQPEIKQHNKSVFKGFFGSLKATDEYLEFVFITGVTKFEKVSIFSDLNQLNDISFNEDFSAICGITEVEMQEYFSPEIQMMAQKRKITVDKCLKALKEQYDGYHFHQNGIGVYNPFDKIDAVREEKQKILLESATNTGTIQQIDELEAFFNEHADGVSRSMMKV